MNITVAGSLIPLQQKDLSMQGVIERFRLSRTGGTGPRPQHAYSQVAAVYAAVKIKAEALSTMPLMISTADDEVVESGPLVQLTQCPNDGTSGRGFWRATSAFLDLFGRVHWVFNFDAGGRPVEVFAVNPLQMQPRLDRHTGELLGWTFRPAGKRLKGQEQQLSLEDVHTIIDPDFEDVNNPFEGLSPRRVATLAISQYWKSDLANEASLDNGVEPGGAFNMPGTPSDEQIKDLREQIDERHVGVMKRRRFMLLYGGMDWKQIAANFKDMEFANLKKMSRVDIAAAFNVPPAVLGYYEDSNYAHADAAQTQFWINTNLPRAAWLAEEFDVAVVAKFENDRSLGITDARTACMHVSQRVCYGYKFARNAVRRTDRRFYSWFDSSGIPAVQKAQLAQAEQAKAWIEKGVPLNQVIRAYDLPFEETKWGETWWRPLTLIDVREDVAFPGADDPTGAPDDSTPGSETAIDAPRVGDVPYLDIDKKSDATRARLWQQWRAAWAGLERAMRGKMRRHFHELRSEVLENLSNEFPTVQDQQSIDAERRDLIGNVLFEIVAANKTLSAKVGPLIRDSYRLGGQQSMDEAATAQGQDEPDVFNIEDPQVQAKLRRRNIMVVETNTTLRRRLANTLADGVSDNETHAELAERIRQEFDYASTRANTIARTEVGAAVEEARHEGRNQAGVPLKTWLWSRRETGRSEHAATELATMDNPIPNSQDFEIEGTGITAPHPRASGVAEHDINCGCTTLSRYPNDSIKSVMDRYMAHGFLTYEQLGDRDRHAALQSDEAK